MTANGSSWHEEAPDRDSTSNYFLYPYLRIQPSRAQVSRLRRRQATAAELRKGKKSNSGSARVAAELAWLVHIPRALRMKSVPSSPESP